MAVELITFSGKSVTAMNDAIVNDTEIGESGILYGCEITASGSVITVGGGYGLIKGRLFQITTTTLNANISGSQGVGQVFVKLDLSNNTTPISFLVRTGGEYVTMESDENANYTNGIYWVEMARFVYDTSSGITDIQTTYRVLHKGVQFITDSDWSLDSLVDSGWYYFNDSHIPTDVPDSILNGWVYVVRGGYAVKQILLRQGSEQTQSEIYVRTYTGGAWTTWAQIPKYSDVFHVAGEQVALAYDGGAYITASSTSIRFLIPFSKIGSKVSGATFVSGLIVARQNGKYIAGNADANYTLSTSEVTILKRNNGLLVYINKRSGYSGATNNSPVAVHANITFRFT